MRTSPLLSAGKTVEAVARLRDAITSFAKREKQLQNGYIVNTGQLKDRYEHETQEASDQLALALVRTTEDFEQRRVDVEATYGQRIERIDQAHRTAKQILHQQVQATTGQGKYDKQKQELQATRDREAAITHVQEEFAAVQQSVVEEQRDLQSLEKTARKAFRGYPKFGRGLTKQMRNREPLADAPDDNAQLLTDLRETIDAASSDLGDFQTFGIPRFFRNFPAAIILVLIMIAHGAIAPLLYQKGAEMMPYIILAGSMIVLMGVVIVIHARGLKVSEESAIATSEKLGRARRLVRTCLEDGEARLSKAMEQVEADHKAKLASFDEDFRSALQDASLIRGEGPELDARKERVLEKNTAIYETRLQALGPEEEKVIADLKLNHDSTQKQRDEQFKADNEANEARYQTNWETMVAEWKTEMAEISEVLSASHSAAAELFPAWSVEMADAWQPPLKFENTAQFATLNVDLDKLAEEHPESDQLALPEPRQFDLPVMLQVPDEGSLLIETKQSGRDIGIETLNNTIMRILSIAPPGKVSFTVLDPVGLGESFAGVMHLADFEEHVIHSKIWTQSSQIEARLGELNEHMEKVIQMYLRNEYETIHEYNEKAGNIAEKYHFLVIADFPHGFSDIAAKRLMSIAQSGGRCGVYTLMHWDTRQDNLPNDFVPQDIRERSIRLLSSSTGGLRLAEGFGEGAELVVEKPPTGDLASNFIQRVGQASIDSGRVEVPFSHVAPPEGQLWTEDTTKELKVPIGRTGATKLQYMAIGKGTRQHALLAGKTGSGKSTLFHVMITNLALWHSPDEVEFYLIDFKKGVEFKAYANKRLPHAKVVAIESDREFGLSVLQRIDEELKRRGEMFRKLGAQDIAGYKRAGGTEAIPRSLLLIDEFQEFFIEDDRVSQNAALLLDRIVRQGRAFGIHAILGSQTLGGAFTLARTTLGQMVIRIALQCNEADSYLIMDDGNPAARLLTRPGEGIYNDSAGAIEGNSPFQVVWLDEPVRDEYLDRITAKAEESGKYWEPPVVFEGNAPADVRENGPLQQLLAGKTQPTPGVRHVWIGAPNSIKGPTEFMFQRQAGSNVMVVGQRDESVLGILTLSLISLSAQHRNDGAQFIIFDGTAPESSERAYLHGVAGGLPQEVIIAHPGDVDKVMGELDAERKRRAENEGAGTEPPVYIFVHGLQKYKKLRHEDDFGFGLDDDAKPNSGAIFTDLITEGASVGMHIIVFCDTYNNITRALSRKALTEFEMRVLFQMSANDSAALIDSPKASNLGLNRALYYNEQEGYLETFRPYAIPEQAWIDEVTPQLQALA